MTELNLPIRRVKTPQDFKGVPDLYWLVRMKRVTIQRTSLIGYQRLLNSGYIAKHALLVWRCIWRAGPCTGAELTAYMDANGFIPEEIKDKRAFCTRALRKMQRQGYLITFPERENVVTGELEIEWAVSDWPPLYPPRLTQNPSLKKMLPQAIQDMHLGYSILFAKELKSGKSFKEVLKRFAGFAEVIRRITKEGGL